MYNEISTTMHIYLSFMLNWLVPFKYIYIRNNIMGTCFVTFMANILYHCDYDCLNITVNDVALIKFNNNNKNICTIMSIPTIRTMIQKLNTYTAHKIMFYKNSNFIIKAIRVNDMDITEIVRNYVFYDEFLHLYEFFYYHNIKIKDTDDVIITYIHKLVSEQQIIYKYDDIKYNKLEVFTRDNI